ncbi:MAG: Pyridoxamine 5'-phosphate oxidase [Parcubacteria group bacterium GW2011_GWC1_41_7]|nr:MAG: Pyridoxamine 5'-phosphate oxidase [Parcubacteria group bacterium GW2011_GWC1_41_7]
MEKKRKILEFFKKNVLCVLATHDSEHNKPECAVIVFTETENFEIIFGCLNNARKYGYLQKNPKVAFSIGWNGEENITVQYEGVAKEVTGVEFEQCRDINLKKNPSSKKFAFLPEQRYFRVQPTWIRYSDFSKNPIEEFEIKF